MERNDERRSIAFACRSAVPGNDWDEFHRRTTIISQYYELLYNCDDTNDLETTLVDPIAREAMTELAMDVNLLPWGDACEEDAILFGVALGAPDQLRHTIACDKLTYRLMESSAVSTPQCCQTVQMDMEVLLLHDDDTTEEDAIVQLQNRLIQILNAPRTSLPAKTLAIPDPTRRYQHHASAEDADTSDGEVLMGDRGLTITGGLLVGVLLLSIVSFVVVAYRRSRRRTHHQRMIDIYKDDDDEMNHMESTIDPDSSDYSSHHGACGIYRTPAADTSCYSMAESLRDSIFWREYSYQIEMDEISEADSWAQTDATVGSLEERLEQITAEI